MFEQLLEPDEQLIWNGAPSADRLLMKIDYFLVPIGAIVMIVGFVGFFTQLHRALNDETTWLTLIVAVGAFWIGFHMVLGHFIRRRRLAKSTVYAVTDTRVVRARVHGDKLLAIRSVAFADQPTMRVRPEYEGRATFIIGSVLLYNVPEAARVETLLRQRL